MVKRSARIGIPVLLPFLCALVAASVAPAQSASTFARTEKAPGIFQVGRLGEPALRESSGVVPSAATNLYWTHNDGDSGVLFLIRPTGETLARVTVGGGAIADWEDLARDDSGNLYVGDIGNNMALRRELRVHRIPEPPTAQSRGTVSITKTWRLRFPGKAFDCEGLFVWQEHGYVVSKVFNDQRAAIYRFPLNSTEAVMTLEQVTDLPVTSPVTGADLSADGKTLALVTRSGAYLFQVDGDLNRAGAVRPRFASFREGQIEGCCLVAEGLLAVSEKREVFLYTPAAFRLK